jgi:CBS domain containing-hemolysin-like protein
MTIDDFDEMVGTRLARDCARTKAGLVIAERGRRPEPGDAIVVDDFRLSVDPTDGLRIAQVRVSVPPAARKA